MFSAKDKATACGMWSSTYMIALIITFTAVFLLIYLSRNLKKEQIERVIKLIAAFAGITEIIKMVFVRLTYGEEKVDILPLYFCSLFIYATIMASLKNETLKTTGLAFLFYGGIMGASAFFLYPSTCIPNYPIYHFMCIRTLTYHGLMIYTGIMIVLTGYYRPRLRDLRNYAVSLAIVCAAAYLTNRIIGKNYMYLMKPIKVAVSQAVFATVPALYPFFVMIVELVLPVALTLAPYILGNFLYTKANKEAFSWDFLL